MDPSPSNCTLPKQVTIAGRTFSEEDLRLIRQILATYPKLSRHELAATVCELLAWERPNGKLKTRECRDLLELMAERDAAPLPEKRPGRPRGSATRSVAANAEPGATLTGPLAALQPVRLVLADTPERRQQWRGYIERYHYLGYRTPFGAHLCYLIQGSQATQVVGALQYSSPAWRMQARDQWIGWDDATRARKLQHIVNQSRFLILPWVEVKNLASHVLALSARQLVSDWQRQYHVRPVLLESFVNAQRFAGTCYRAANWICVGRTTGRGRMDRTHGKHGREPKQIYLYPLVKQVRTKLASAEAVEE